MAQITSHSLEVLSSDGATDPKKKTHPDRPFELLLSIYSTTGLRRERSRYGAAKADAFHEARGTGRSSMRSRTPGAAVWVAVRWFDPKRLGPSTKIRLHVEIGEDYELNSSNL